MLPVEGIIYGDDGRIRRNVLEIPDHDQRIRYTVCPRHPARLHQNIASHLGKPPLSPTPLYHRQILITHSSHHGFLHHLRHTRCALLFFLPDFALLLPLL